ncbi:MAG TPA: glutamate synthase-related protein, partial [Ferruginibacter sp.]|nr:glutamate synthase-related protein [Ferruginibacter sp.]
IEIEENDLSVSVGNQSCKLPYQSTILNTAVFTNRDFGNSFFTHSENEEMIANDEKKYDNSYDKHTYKLNGQDLVWQIEPSYMGCRSSCGNFSSVLFKRNAINPAIKMIELKLSDTFVTEDKASPGITDIKDGYLLKSNFPANKHTAFTCAESMIIFVGNLQKLSGGKPVGIRLFINDKKKFYEICYAIRKTKIAPDFIAVEGSADYYSKTNSTTKSMPLYEALRFVSGTLKHYNVHKEIKIIASTRITSGLDMIKLIALGADSVCTYLQTNAVNKLHNSYTDDFRNNTIQAMINIMKTCGFKNLHDITMEKLFRWLDVLPLIAAEQSNELHTELGSVKILKQHDIKYKRTINSKQAAIL